MFENTLASLSVNLLDQYGPLISQVTSDFHDIKKRTVDIETRLVGIELKLLEICKYLEDTKDAPGKN